MQLEGQIKVEFLIRSPPIAPNPIIPTPPTQPTQTHPALVNPSVSNQLSPEFLGLGVLMLITTVFSNGRMISRVVNQRIFLHGHRLEMVRLRGVFLLITRWLVSGGILRPLGTRQVFNTPSLPPSRLPPFPRPLVIPPLTSCPLVVLPP